MARQKTTSRLRKDAWNALSLWFRQTSADHAGNVVCYTCGNTLPWKEAHSGHGIGGRTNAVLFDLEIIRIQDYACNVGRGGNYPVFVTKLIKENGLEWWEKKLHDSKQIVKFTRGELIELAEFYKQKLSELKNGN